MSAFQRRAGVVVCGDGDRCSGELDDFDGRCDGRSGLDHECEASRTALAGESKEAVERGAVDEHDPIQIEHERGFVLHQLVELLGELLRIREVEFAGKRS